jgi:enoyl-CoA hydratase
VAERVAKIPSELQQINKRSVHRAMEIMGLRAAIRAGTELQALAFHQPASLAYRAEIRKNLGRALKERDTPFGDYRGREDP